MASFSEVSEVESALTRLAEREGGPFVTRLAREPGRRESRYAHLFSGEVAGAGDMQPHAPAQDGGMSGLPGSGDLATGHSGGGDRAGHKPDDGSAAAHWRLEAGGLGEHAGPRTVSAPEMSFPDSRQELRLARLEEEVQALRAELNDLKARLGD
jgi:uncharacterized protein YceH (UPF0502 family)